MPMSGETAAERLQAALAELARPEATARERARAEAAYRRALADILPTALAGEAGPGLTLDAGDPPRRLVPADLAVITPVADSRSGTPDTTVITDIADTPETPGLHRPGLGLPTVARIASDDPHVPPPWFSGPRDPGGAPGLGGREPDEIESPRSPPGG